MHFGVAHARGQRPHSLDAPCHTVSKKNMIAAMAPYRSAISAVFKRVGQPGPNRPCTFLSQMIPCAEEVRAPAILHEYFATWEYPAGGRAYGCPLYPIGDFDFRYLWCLVPTDTAVDAVAVSHHTRGGVYLVRAQPAQAFVHGDGQVHLPGGMTGDDVRVVRVGDNVVYGPRLDWASIHAAAPNTRTLVMYTYRLKSDVVQPPQGMDPVPVLENLIFTRPVEAAGDMVLAVITAVARYVRWVVVPEGRVKWCDRECLDSLATAFTCEGSSLHGVVLWLDNDEHKPENAELPAIAADVDVVHLSPWLTLDMMKADRFSTTPFGHWTVVKRRGVVVPAWPVGRDCGDATAIVRNAAGECARVVTSELWACPAYESMHPPPDDSDESESDPSLADGE